MAPRMKQKLATKTLSLASTLTLGNYIHIRTHTSDPVQKTFTGNALEDIFISIYFYLDYLQERKRQPFLKI